MGASGFIRSYARVYKCGTHSKRARLTPSPRLRGRVGVRSSFGRHGACMEPLTRPPSAVDLSPQAGRGGSPRRRLAQFDRAAFVALLQEPRIDELRQIRHAFDDPELEQQVR